MNKLIVVALIAAGLVAAAVFLGSGPHNDLGQRTAVLPTLSAQINDVDRLQIRSADGTTTLQRGAEGWLVAERDYPADTGKLRALMLKLADLTVVEPKTAKPALYSRLGVQDFNPAEPGNQQILLWAGDAQLPGLLVGNTSTQPRGSYVRVIGEGQSALASAVVSAAAKPASWLRTDLVDVKPDALERISVTHPDGDYVIARSGQEPELELATVPDNRSEEPAAVARVTRALQNLRAEDVLPRVAQPAIEQWITLQLEATNGTRYVMETAQDGSGDDARRLLKLAVENIPAAADGDAGAQAANQALREAAARVRGRTFVIQSYKANDLSLSLAQLLQPLPGDDDAE